MNLAVNHTNLFLISFFLIRVCMLKQVSTPGKVYKEG